MLADNKERFDYLGITNWHKQGLKGKGIKILVIDSSGNIKIEDTRLKDRVSTLFNSNSSDHGFKVCDIVNQIMPESTIYFVSSSNKNKAIEFAMENKIDIITMSLGGGDSISFSNLCKKAAESGIILCKSAGNKGEKGLTYPADEWAWIAVGSCQLRNGIPVRASSSSIGEDLEIMSLSYQKVTMPNGKIETFTGTSCASPVFACMFAMFIKQLNRKLSKDDLRSILYKYTTDLEDKGRDKKTGFGIFRLPLPNYVR